MLSYLYRAGVAIRNRAYDKGFLKSYPAPIPVISVGNIVAGGTGKTPFVKLLAETLMPLFNVAILSRGYLSTAEEPLLVTPATTVSDCGDEPYWLARELPEVLVFVGPHRLTLSKKAAAHRSQVAILDDGMQHRSLKRDVEITMINGQNPFGGGFFLPKGLLRDSVSRLQQADLIVIKEPISTEAITVLRRLSSAPLIGARMETSISLEKKEVAVFCAIGNPDSLLNSVKEKGGKVIATFFKPDHTPFYPKEIEKFSKNSGAKVLLCTEKDHVKFPPHYEPPIPLIVLRSQLKITFGLEVWENVIDKIKQLCRCA